MELKRRGQPESGKVHQQERKSEPDQQKAHAISRIEFEKAWQRVRAKGGKGGVDGESIKSFESKRDAKLYKLWNRMTSGSYHPKAVLRVEIPKGDGKTRPLGIPTIKRVAQQVVKARLEPIVESFFHPDSYGYRPGKSAKEAVGIGRKRCWEYDWVLDVDIQKFFDSIDHELMMKAVNHHVKERWIVLYIERWLKASIEHPDGTQEKPERGTPQGGVISPVLANLYLHYAFDCWMKRSFPTAPFERYADDIVIHCETEEQTWQVEAALRERLKEVGLELHPEKTKVVYCKDSNRKGRYPTKKYTFLGYTFQPRGALNSRTKKKFTNFSPAVGKPAEKKFRAKLKSLRVLRMTQLSLSTFAKQMNQRVRGWLGYFKHYYRSALSHMDNWLDRFIVRWLRKKFRLNWTKAYQLLRRITQQQPKLFAHWEFRVSGRAV